MSECNTRDILEALNHDELNALRRRAEWCDRDWKPSRSELIEDLNRTVTGKITHGGLEPTQLVKDINNLVAKQGSNKIETQIKTILRETPITKVADWKSETEGIACAHLTGVLQGRFGYRFEITQEESVGNKYLDIYLKDRYTEEEYLVEAKVNKRFSRVALENQLKEYHSLLENRKKTYVVFIAFGEDLYEYQGEDEETILREFLDEETIELIENVDENVEMILNLNPN